MDPQTASTSCRSCRNSYSATASFCPFCGVANQSRCVKREPQDTGPPKFDIDDSWGPTDDFGVTLVDMAKGRSALITLLVFALVAVGTTAVGLVVYLG